jgi:murein DD-endopeptidase MepM/ murein hydrolase activator NlpD
MVIIKTDPQANLTIDDQALAVSKNGFAVIGFHRDDIAPVDVVAQYPDGRHDTLTITPTPREFKEQRIDGLPQNMVTPPQDVLDRIARDRAEVSQARAVISDLNGWQQDFIWPSHGIITGVYGSRRILNGQPRAPHYGIDIAAATGTPVKAPADGVITMVDDLYFTGITIIMDHGHGISSTFLHLNKANISVGMAVKQGDIIGEVGSTGRSTGAHLDWRINWFTKRLDPALLAGSMPNS